MTSPNHQPYKSRLFNFVNRQSLRWGDRLLRSAQYLRVGVEWSVQILIYPLYMMVQAVRATGKQLQLGWQQKALPSRKHNLSASTPEVDRPLKRVFRETQQCLTQTKREKGRKKSRNGHQTSSSIMVQGIASDIETKNLVLVAENNRIIDILSEAQQQHLNKYIRLETANYWYDLKQHKRNKLELIHTPEDYHVLPPIRWFWQGMRWMQTGQLAMNLDFFAESSLVPVAQKSTLSPSSNKSLVSVNEPYKKEFMATSFNVKMQQWRVNIREKSHQSLNIETEDPFQLKFLIYAAIDYFFNQVFSEHQLDPNSSLESLQYSTVTNQKNDDSWLSCDDSYGEQITTENHLSPAFLAQENKSSHRKRNQLKQNARGRIKQSTSLSKAKINRQKNGSITKNTTNSQHPNNNKIDIVSSNWVETEAKSTGYIKHPLVRILEWLDTAIHWLEELGKKLAKLFFKKP
ncbi:MAG: hypothetical protein AB4062_08050 [Crocosphaera sp.]